MARFAIDFLAGDSSERGRHHIKARDRNKRRQSFTNTLLWPPRVAREVLWVQQRRV